MDEYTTPEPVVPPVAAPAGPQSDEPITVDVNCIDCGYSLQGLKVSSLCPECSTPVENSIRGDLFVYAPIEYVRTMYSGSMMVVGSILALVIVSIFIMIFQLAAASSGLSTIVVQGVTVGAQVVGMLTSLVLAWGWWKLSAPNPNASLERAGTTARLLVRWAAGVSAVFTVVSTVVSQVVGLNQAATSATPNWSALWFVIGISVLNLIIFGVAYFSQMQYLRWVGPRLPNPWVSNRAKLMVWLGPLIYIVGALCIGLGPLVALILYYNLITKVRGNLKSILAGMERGLV